MTLEGSKRKLLFVAVLGAVLIQLSPVWLLKEQIRNGSSDFSAFYSAGRIVSAGHGGQLYDLGVQREAQRIFSEKFGRPPLLPFNHPPFEALIFAPLSLLPYGMAFVVWMSCNIAMSIGAIFLVRPYLQSLQNSFDLALIATSFFAPLLVAISQGQDSIILLFLFALCLVSLLRGREGLAGCTLALAMFKPQLALPAMLMFTLAHERWRRLLAGFFSTCIALSLVSVGVVGWRALYQLPCGSGSIRSGKSGSHQSGRHAEFAGPVPCNSWGSESGPILYLCIAAFSAALMGMAIAAWRSGSGARDSLLLNFALVVTATVLVAFHGNLHDSTLLILPILISADWVMRERVDTVNRGVLAASVAALFVLPMFWQNRQLLCCATLVLFVAIWSELHRSRAGGQQRLSAAAPTCG